jgi:hypothetical protein
MVRLGALEAITLRPLLDEETTYGLLAGHATGDESEDVRAAAVVLLQALYATTPDDRILETLRDMARFDASRQVRRSAEDALRGLYADETSGDDPPEGRDHPGDPDGEFSRGS